LGGLHAVVMSLLPNIEPQKILHEIVSIGYDTDTVAAMAGAILGARFGCQWIPVDKLIDNIRLEAYADTLVNPEHGPPEDMSSLMEREKLLTKFESDFQGQITKFFSSQNTTTTTTTEESTNN